jgi:hypothetical protein
MGHAKHGGRQKGTPNAISARARKVIMAAAKRIPRGTTLNRNHWQWVIEKNPLINEARERQGQFTLTSAPRFRSREFNMKAFCKDLSAVAMRAIQTDQFIESGARGRVRPPAQAGTLGEVPKSSHYYHRVKGWVAPVSGQRGHPPVQFDPNLGQIRRRQIGRHVRGCMRGNRVGFTNGRSRSRDWRASLGCCGTPHVHMFGRPHNHRVGQAIIQSPALSDRTPGIQQSPSPGITGSISRFANVAAGRLPSSQNDRAALCVAPTQRIRHRQSAQ